MNLNNDGWDEGSAYYKIITNTINDKIKVKTWMNGGDVRAQYQSLYQSLLHEEPRILSEIHICS